MNDIKINLEKIINSPVSNESEIIGKIKNFIYEYDLNTSNTRETKPLSNLMSESIKALQSDQDLSKTIKTGYKELDKIIGGFSPGEFVVIGGRPAMGKTQVLINLALNISQVNPVLYFTFDLSEFLLTSRFLSSLSKIGVDKILQQNLSIEEKTLIAALDKQIGKHQIFINDSCNDSISSFKAHCTKQIKENGVKIIFVDYLQMMSSNKYRNSRELEISYISRVLKNIAKDNDVCVIASSQLSRAVESRGGDRKPYLADLRESGAIEQDADKVIFIYRPEYYGLTQDENGNNTAGLTELIISKNRNGSLGSAMLKHDASFTTFKDFDGYTNEFSFSSDRLKEIEEAPF
ncbi:MAG: DnaB-like helicase C-terminal domain-containing protein [Bacteroidetes bacterium]|nr:DnaB-like helicase C-terminal domain-containing protein [Bacteroidota bacterium]